MLKAKVLSNNNQDVQNFISEIFAHQRQWYFSLENRVNSKIEIKADKDAVWFGAFEGSTLIACACLSVTKDRTSSSTYLNNPVLLSLINDTSFENLWEINVVAFSPQHTNFKVAQTLFLELFKYCEVKHLSVLACTNHGYLKSFYDQIQFPRKIEKAFKNQSEEEIAVDVYCVNNKEIKQILSALDTTVLDAKDHFEQELKREQNKFQRIVDQVLHDIRSPLSSLSMIIGVCAGIQEEDRIALRSAISRITDITNNLQKEYHLDGGAQAKAPQVADKYDSLLVSTALLEILGEKRYQYKLLNVRFEQSFSQSGNFVFANMDPAVFKRMMSNVLNNAVDAVDQNAGIITVRLLVDNDLIKIIVQDNGRGMPDRVIEQIMKPGPVNTKEVSRGSGLMQVRQSLEENKGSLLIESVIGSGTKITVMFPKVASPSWLADNIELNGDDLVVILDDEPSIHGAWNSRFRLHTKRVAIKHFESGREVINFINYLPAEKQKKIFLLADYELQHQDINGLEVIEQTKVTRSVLVTSHYASKKLRADVEAFGIKLLPKMLAPEVTITVDAKVEPAEGKKEVSMIFADDDKEFVTNMIRSLFAGQYVETFFDPEHLLQDILKYKKDTKICLDNNFEKSGIKGVEVAERLYEKGFTNLYMLSGNVVDVSLVPSYLRVILKNDIEGIKRMRDA